MFAGMCHAELPTCAGDGCGREEVACCGPDGYDFAQQPLVRAPGTRTASGAHPGPPPICMKEPRGPGIFAEVCACIRDRDAPGLEACLSGDRFAVLETDAEGNSALHYAAIRGNVEAAAELLRHGADPDATNAGGNTAMDIATRIPDTAMVRCLIAMSPKAASRAQSLRKRQHADAGAPDRRRAKDTEDEILTIQPAVREAEWEPYFLEHQKNIKEAFYRGGQRPPREEMAARVAGLDQQTRVDHLCKIANGAADRRAQRMEDLQTVSVRRVCCHL